MLPNYAGMAYKCPNPSQRTISFPTAEKRIACVVVGTAIPLLVDRVPQHQSQSTGTWSAGRLDDERFIVVLVFVSRSR